MGTPDDKPWASLPPTPSLPAAIVWQSLQTNGVEIRYTTYGEGPPVILLHGGIASSDYWGCQIPALVPGHRVILMDSRNQGRSPMRDAPLNYREMAADVVALLDALDIERAAAVGWSDGAVTGLMLAVHYRNRIDRLFATGVNTDPAAMRPDAPTSPVIQAYMTRAGQEYAMLSPTPERFGDLLQAAESMWLGAPYVSDEELASITTRCAIAQGAHDEAIDIEHVRHVARTIPGCQLTVLEHGSHFVMLQVPEAFNQVMLEFLRS